jgi:hypothetical protein
MAKEIRAGELCRAAWGEAARHDTTIGALMRAFAKGMDAPECHLPKSPKLSPEKRNRRP